MNSWKLVHGRRRALISFRMDLAVEVSGLTIMVFSCWMLVVAVGISQFPRDRRSKIIFCKICTKQEVYRCPTKGT